MSFQFKDEKHFLSFVQPETFPSHDKQFHVIMKSELIFSSLLACVDTILYSIPKALSMINK